MAPTTRIFFMLPSRSHNNNNNQWHSVNHHRVSTVALFLLLSMALMELRAVTHATTTVGVSSKALFGRSMFLRSNVVGDCGGGGLAFVVSSTLKDNIRTQRRRPQQRRQALLAMQPTDKIDARNPSNRNMNGDVPKQQQQTPEIPSFPPSHTLQPLSPHVVVSQLPNGGRITLVGSGPGDPSLLTVAADRLLRDPNVVVIADRLVSAEIMELVVSKNVHVARKWPGCAEQAQEEIYHWTYQALLQGKHVIRLKIGDPFVFGRGAEEILTFRQWGIEPKAIPGVSAALSAPLLGSIPVTHRGVANQLVICTGYGREGTCPDLIRYHPEQTVVFLMAVGRLRELSQQLQHLAGYPSDMPVAIVERAACPDQRTIVGTLETIANVAEHYQAQAPSTIVVGRVVHVLLDQEQSLITTQTSPEAKAVLATAISAATTVSQTESREKSMMQNNSTAAFAM